MKKIACILLVFFLIPFNVVALEQEEINSKSAIVYDITSDNIIFEKDSNEVMNIASLTKIMTVITAIEKTNDLNTIVTINSNMLKGIYWNASKAGLKVGDKVTIKDLLYASILPSGADATNSLAYAISGNISDFVEEMNLLANKIGMNNTHFENTTGLDTKNHYSTASDLMLLLKYALNNPTFKDIYTTKEYTLTNGLKIESTLKKYNEKLQLDLSRIIGSKTGNTTNAGLCMSALVEKENHEIIIITLKGERIEQSYYNLIDTLNIIDYIDQDYAIKKETIEIPVIKVEDASIKILKKTVKYHYEFIIVLILFIIFLVTLIKKVIKKGSKK